MKHQHFSTFLILIFLTISASAQTQNQQRARELGIETGILTPGKWNAITDVAGVKVGHQTIIEGDDIRTGVTAILPHDGNIFRERVPAAVFVGNGFGKALGFTQVRELGEIETPIALTNTLSIHTVANGVADYVLNQPENENVRSVNPVVGETNDGWLNNIRERNVGIDDAYAAIENAKSGSVNEGNVGAGTGTRALGFKGGIGTSSRVLPRDKGGYTVGVLVQSNFGGILTINGAPVGKELNNHYMANEVPYDVDGSIMIIVATDAPITSRNLERLAKRAFLGVARVGGFASNGSGDYVIAFSTSEDVRIHQNGESTNSITELKNDAMTPLFLAAVEATEEAILNSLFAAETITGWNGHTQEALPVDEVMEILKKYNAVEKQ
ncbi:DmpA family aminopeptidase [Rhodohalobacter sp. 614A]|uniref:DmpA family aminopeptidase n=1 Tax=Rhodohalobacter sp. 614A TaxID=2908649 RepID=UPI001F2BCD63|nr:P1 family peptidase [Rhodohalobacter sp. 614A]